MLCVTHRGTAAPEPQQRPNNGSTDSPNAPSSVSHTRGLSPLVVRTFPQVISSIRISRSGGAPGTPGAWITPPPAPTPRTLTLKGGFTVLDSQQRRLHRHARAQGHSDLASYLQARAQQQTSPAQLASELAPPSWLSATCWTPQASPRHPPGDRRPPTPRQHRPAPGRPRRGAGLPITAGM